MNIREDKKLMKVARLFYESNISKTEIAKDRMISVTHVNRMLNIAKQKGIVEVNIKAQHFEDLEIKLAEKYELIDVKVISYTEDEDYLRYDLGQAAANYFSENVKDNQKVGIGSGRTVYQMIANLKEKSRKIKIYPINIITQRKIKLESLDANSLVNILWFKNRPLAEAFKIELFYPHKNVDDTIKEIKGLANFDSVKDFLRNILNLNFYFLSIANLQQDSEIVSLASEMGISLSLMKEKKIIGDCIFNTIDKDGNYISCGIEKQRLGLTLENLKNLNNQRKSRVVCIAGGTRKIEVLKTTLINKIFNVLITDQKSAISLL